MAGGQAVKFVTLNDATKQAGSWTPEARGAPTLAVRRRTPPTVAFIGEFNSGASAVSIPITNEAGLPMISPSNTYDRPDHQRSRHQPGRTREVLPDGVAHLLPPDAQRHRPGRRAGHRDARPRLQADRRRRTTTRSTAWAWARSSRQTARAARPDRGREPSASAASTRSYRSITAVQGRLRRSTPASPPTAPSGMFRGVGRSLRKAQLFGKRRRRRVRLHPPPARFGRQARHVTVSTLAPDAYPGGAAVIGNADPYKIYGYEAMKLILDGLNAAGPSKAGLLGCPADGRPEPRERARHLLLRRQRRHDPAHLRPLWDQAGRASYWVGAVTAA